MQEHQPGEVIVPLGNRPVEGNSTSAPAPAPTPEPAQANVPETPSVPAPDPTLQQTSPEPIASPSPTDTSAWYHPDSSVTTPPTAQPMTEQLTWEAAEFAHHAKTPAWYGLAVVASLILAGVVYVLNHDIATSIIVFLAITGLAYFSGRLPRTQQYLLDRKGVQVGTKYYDFADFQSFWIVADTPTSSSIVLTPLKRFMPLVNVNIPLEHEENVVSLLSSVLPMQEGRADMVDSFMRRLRF